jgi:hypothetical protein
MTGGATGTGPGNAIGTPAISVSGRHTPAAAGAGACPADVSTQSAPPVLNGTANAVGLNATATPHNPAPTTAVILPRSKTVIDVDPFIYLR